MPPNQQFVSEELFETLKLLEDLIKEKKPKIYEDHQGLYELRDQLVQESDRGLCLLAIGRMDNVLTEFLQLKLLGSKTFKRDLFNNNGPLGTFSSKIKMCLAMGLISNGYYQEIEVMRKIRNIFAHSDQPITFESKEVETLCLGLKVFAAQKGRPNRSKFISTFLFVITGIYTELRTAVPFEEKKEQLSQAAINKVEKTQQEVRSMFDIIPGTDSKNNSAG